MKMLEIELDCPWYYFDNSYKILLGACLIVFGLFGLILNGWLFITFIYSHLLKSKSHLLILNLCTACLGRNLFSFPFSGSSAIAKRWIFDYTCCQLFGFFSQFLGLFQMSSITALCIERYSLAKYYKNNTELSIKWYILVISSCWCWAIVFSAPTLLGYGSFLCDPTRTVCTLDWTPNNARQLGLQIPLIVIGGVLPVYTMIHLIARTVTMERRHYKSEEMKEQRNLTKCVIAVACITLALWSPAAALVGWQWVPQLLSGHRRQVPALLALVAPVASEGACCVPVLVYLAAQARLRAALLGRVRTNYALLADTTTIKGLLKS